MLNGNIFREAKELLKAKPMMYMDGEELITVKTALIPLDILPEFNDLTTLEGLERLESIYDDAKRR